jgi:hypothetical protein
MAEEEKRRRIKNRLVKSNSKKGEKSFSVVRSRIKVLVGKMKSG